MSQTKPALDWTHLPPNTAAKSLWEPLHDGELQTIQSSLRERTVLLEFDVPHLRQHHELGSTLRFLLKLEEVQSARVSTWVSWPGGFVDIPHETREERSLRIDEYQAKGREESFDWKEFVDILTTGKLLIYDAQIAKGKDTVALQIEGNLSSDDFADLDDQYFTLFLRAKQLTIQQSDGITFSLESFIELGTVFWNAFSARSKSHSAALTEETTP